MNHSRIIEENMLDAWVRSHALQAQGVTVELVYRLVSTSCPAPIHRRFPLSDSIGQHGPDGELDTLVGSPPFVPDGKSFWEIGAGLDARKKANSDYDGLTSSIPEPVRKASAFIFVTPLSGRRGWENTWEAEGIAEWVHERQNRKEWADVKVLNAASLIDWLYRLPAVERWLAKIMGLKIDAIETIDERWDTLRMIGSPPPLPPELFTVNRDDAVLKVRKLILDHEGTQLKLDTRHSSQPGDFLSAFALTLPDDQRIEVVGRCLIITGEDAWLSVCSLTEPHVFVADFDLESERGPKLIQAALNRRHVVIFAGAPGGVPHANRVGLPMPDEFQIKECLEKAGYPSERARRLSNTCRSDLNTLLRVVQGLSATPEWAQRSEAAEIAIAMLIGGWTESSKGDLAAVEQIVGKNYGEWISVVRNIADSNSTPLQNKDGRWYWTSRFESWHFLGKYLHDDALDRFKVEAVAVLRELDPALELPPEDRFAATLHDKARKFSSRLRKGLAETLALIGTYPKPLSCSTGFAESTARSAVGQILMNATWELWASLDDVLPLLAEASPEAFLDGVESSISGKDSVFPGVFAQERSSAIGSTYITGLLWGLETLAWEPSYLLKVCRILGELAALDPGGNWTNRPSNSLITIFLPWFPQTSAVVEDRHAAVTLIAKRQPDVGWKLLCSLLPEGHGSSSMGSHKPSWRQYIPENRDDRVSNSQYWEEISFYGEMALDLAKYEPGRLSTLIKRYFHLPGDLREKLRSTLTSDGVLNLAEEQRFVLWTELTTLTGRHRRFADHENWKVPEGALAELETIAARLSPTALDVRHQRLFGGNDFDLYEGEGEWEKEREKIDVRRQSAVSEILSAGGVPALLAFVRKVNEPWRVGTMLGSLQDFSDDGKILPGLLVDESQDMRQLAGGFVIGRFKMGGWKWVDQMIDQNWTTREKSQYFTHLPFSRETWNRVSSYLGQAEGEYWKAASAHPYDDAPGIETAIEKLIQFGKADGAVSCISSLGHSNVKVKSSLVIAALDALSGESRIDAYEIGELIKMLQNDPEVSEMELGRIEWAFLSLLDEFHHAQPVCLARAMARDPEFFCVVIKLVYKSKKESEQVAVTDELKAKAMKAYRLLDGWRVSPGLNTDGSFDAKALNLWVAKVKSLCLDSGHWDVAANEIGKVLFYAPEDEHGIWTDPVCRILDERDHKYMRIGLTTEILNSRGVFSYTGGKDEMNLAEEWSAKAAILEKRDFANLSEEIKRLADRYRKQSEYESKNNPFERD